MERTGNLIQHKYQEYFYSTLAMSGSTVIANIIDRIIAGNLIGAYGMSAISLTSPIIFVINVIYGLFIYGGNTLSATYRGHRDKKNADQCFTIAIAGGMAVCLFLSAAGLLLLHPLSLLFSAGDEVLYQPVRDYLFPLMFMGIFVIWVNGMAAFVRSDGLKRLAFAIPVVSNAVNLIMDFVFMGVLRLGIGSAGWATNIGFAVAAFLVLPYFRSKKRTVFFDFSGIFHFKRILDIFSTGLASALLNASLLVKNLVMNTIAVSTFGGSGAVVMTLCLSANSLANIFYMGTSQTMLPIGGALYGEKDYTGIRYLLKTAMAFTLSLCLGVMVMLMLFPYRFAALFAVKSISEGVDFVDALRLFSISIPFVGMQNIARSYLQSCGHKNAATSLMILDGTVCFLPFIYLLSILLPSAIWVTFTIAPILSMTAIYIFMLQKLKKEGIHNPLLLPKEQGNVQRLELTMKNNIVEVGEASGMALDFCRRNGISDKLGNLIWLSVQELCSNVAKYAYEGKNGFADVFFRITDEEIVMRVRDDGDMFDPTEFIDESGSLITGLKMLRAMKITLEYNRVLGFNNTIVVIKR